MGIVLGIYREGCGLCEGPRAHCMAHSRPGREKKGGGREQNRVVFLPSLPHSPRELGCVVWGAGFGWGACSAHTQVRFAFIWKVVFVLSIWTGV